MRETDPLIVEYQHDRHRPREDEALLMLRKVASLVKPIMRQRGWRVGTLAEFYPQRNLLGLNVNHGEKICLRLRHPSDDRQFLPMDQVVDTMLHELCHIVHGPHNKEFHALWNQLRDEHLELTIKGYTGEGFLSEGNRLGGRRVPQHEARRLARVAAEKRRALTTGSGRKLGGTAVSRGTDMRRVIADAAQRRITVTEGCASGTGEGAQLAEEVSRNGFKTKAEEDDANERAIMEAYIDLIQEEEREQYGASYMPPSAANPTGPQGWLLDSESPAPTRVPGRSASPPTLSDTATIAGDGGFWACPVCTLINPESFLCCDACSSERPKQALLSSSNPAAASTTTSTKRTPAARNPSRLLANKDSRKRGRSAIDTLISLEKKTAEKPLGWTCHSCGTFMESKWWTCSLCRTMKQSA